MDLNEAIQFRKHLSSLIAAAWNLSGIPLPLYTWFDAIQMELPRPRVECEIPTIAPAGMLTLHGSNQPAHGHALPRLWRATANLQVIDSCRDLHQFERSTAEVRSFALRLADWAAQAQTEDAPLVIAGAVFQSESATLDIAQDLATASIEAELHFSIKPTIL